MTAAAEVVVVGAGVVGAAVAGHLAAAGRRVVLVEAAEPGSGTSSTTFAWVNANQKEPREYFDLNAASMALHREDAGDWYVPSGHVTWADAGSPDATRLRRNDERLRAWGYAVEAPSAAELRRLEPDLTPPAGAALSRYPDEGHLHPDRFLRHLLETGRQAGVELRTGVPARLEVASGRVYGVRLADGEGVAAGAVVLCAGRWTTAVAAQAGVHVPLVASGRGSTAFGMLATTAPVAARLRSVVTSPGLNVRAAGEGRLLLQALDLDEAVDPGSPPGPGSAFANELLRRLAAVLPAAAEARIEEVRPGVRALPADGLPVVGWTAADGLYVAVTHSGMTLAPLLGRLVAAEVCGSHAPELAPFRPGRFGSQEVC